jgi:hypothetical protein
MLLEERTSDVLSFLSGRTLPCFSQKLSESLLKLKKMPNSYDFSVRRDGI